MSFATCLFWLSYSMDLFNGKCLEESGVTKAVYPACALRYKNGSRNISVNVGRFF